MGGKGFDIGDMPAKVKVGNQVISWGEIFVTGSINQINALQPAQNHPGTQLKGVHPHRWRRSAWTDRHPEPRGLLRFEWNAYGLDQWVPTAPAPTWWVRGRQPSSTPELHRWSAGGRNLRGQYAHRALR